MRRWKAILRVRKGGGFMGRWHRLQILVTKEQLRWLKAESYTRSKSIGEIIRELLAEAIKDREAGRR